MAYTIESVNMGMDTLIDEISRLKTKLDCYKKEAEKIPQICLREPCYFDLSPEGRDLDFVQELIDKHCLKICPKWKEKRVNA